MITYSWVIWGYVLKMFFNEFFYSGQIFLFSFVISNSVERKLSCEADFGFTFRSGKYFYNDFIFICIVFELQKQTFGFIFITE